jgi:hypothetical protein
MIHDHLKFLEHSKKSTSTDLTTTFVGRVAATETTVKSCLTSWTSIGESITTVLASRKRRWKIYQDPYFKDNPNAPLEVGYKGGEDAGYFYCPYIPLQE